MTPGLLLVGLRFMALLAAALGVPLFLASSHVDGFFAWTPDHPITAATLGAFYLAAAVLLRTSARGGCWADVRVTVVSALVLLTATAYATFTGPRLARLHDGLIAAGMALGWKVFHVVAPAGVLLGLVVALRGAGNLGPRRQCLPRWTFSGMAVPGLAAVGTGLALLAGVEPLPWPAWGMDAPVLGAWLLATGVMSFGVIVEHDFERLRGPIRAALLLGVLLLVNVLRFDEAGWGYAGVAVLLVLLGAGGLLLGLVLPSDETWARWIRAADGPRRGSANVRPMADAGFFGPNSLAWRVWSYPTSLTVGFQRSVVVEELDPFLVASVDATQRLRNYPKARYDNTIRYFATVVLGDSRTAVKAAETLMKVHRPMVGIEPVSGETYDANAPTTQLWIHLTAWHSILYVYEKYGPGPLSAQDERRYWEDCATAAHLQTCDPEAVPRTRDGIRRYFEQVRPGLVGSEVAARTMDFLLDGRAAFPPWLSKIAPVAWVVNRALRIAVLGTLPRWQRDMVGLQQSPLLDALIVPVMRVSFGAACRLPALEAFILRAISPSAVEIALPVLYGVPAMSAEVLSPAQAFARHGVETPRAIYAGYQREATERAG